MKTVINIGNTNITISFKKGSDIITTKIKRDEYALTNLKSFINENQNIKTINIIPTDKEHALTIANFFHSQLSDVEINIIDDYEYQLDYSKYENNSLGVDRKMAMEAIHKHYKINDFIMVDFGTATTLNVVVNKTFEGGLIIPGLQIMLQALANQTTLNYVDINKANNVEFKNIALNTEDNILYGTLTTTLLGLEKNIELLSKQYNIDFKVFVLGGNTTHIVNILSKDWILTPHILTELHL